MSQPFEIDTDALGRAEAPFRELAQRLVALSNEVQGRVSGLGDVWGDDKTGQQFAAKYGPARDELLTGFSSTGDVVTSTADGVRTMAQGYGRTEESSVDASSQLLARAQSVEVAGLLPGAATGAVEGASPGAVTHARRAVSRGTEPMHAARRVNVDAAPEPDHPAVRARMDRLPVEPGLPLEQARHEVAGTGTLPVTHALHRSDSDAVPVERARSAAVRGVEPTPAVPMERALPAEPALRAEPASPLLPSVGTPAVPAVVDAPEVPAERTELSPRLEATSVRRLVDEPRPTEG